MPIPAESNRYTSYDAITTGCRVSGSQKLRLGRRVAVHVSVSVHPLWRMIRVYGLVQVLLPICRVAGARREDR